MNFIKDFSADEEIVRRLVEHLRQSYQDAINKIIDEGHEVGFWDGFMAAHNFHCLVVVDLEEKMGLDPAGQLLIRNMAITTFKESLERRP